MSYNRGYRNDRSSSYYDNRNANRNDYRQPGNSNKHRRGGLNTPNEVSKSYSNDNTPQEAAKVKVDTNNSAVVNNKESTPVPSSNDGEGLSAEEKRRQRQLRLAKWKERQATPETQALASNDDKNPSSLQSVPVSNNEPVKLKKTFTINKPVKKPTLSRSKLSKLTAIKQPSKPLFDDDEEEADVLSAENKRLGAFSASKEPLQKKAKPNASVPAEDSLDQFMVGIETTGTDSSHSMQEGELIDEDDQEVDDIDESKKNEDSLMELMNKANNINKAKEIPTIEPSDRLVNKRFYDSSLNSLDSQEMLEFAKQNQISIKPENLGLRPVKEFGQLGLTYKMVEILDELKLVEPTPIQKIALPVAMAGHDVIAVAKTGSGKTLLFVLPMIRHIVGNISLVERKKTKLCPIGLILTPTRELALQIYNDSKPFLEALNLRGVCCYGGSNISSQISELKKGAELIVCTPGRLIDLLTANNGRVTNLSEVSSLVLDEADRMFDLGFEPQIMKIIKNIRSDRQTCLFSATFAKKIETLASKILQDPVQLVVGGGRSIVSDTITQRVMIVKPEDKLFKLLKILGDFITEANADKKLLIFCSTQDRCDNLLAQLLQRGYKGLSLHGGKDQVDRDGAINDFQKGVVSLLVATSVAARGLDVKDLEIVVNYDAPNHMEDYVHRVGRTGRLGKKGIAYTFVEPSEERAAHDIAKLLKLSKNLVPDDLNDLALKFQLKLKEGKENYTSGFGGKGLEKLEEVRLKTKNIERKNHGEEPEEVTPVAQALSQDKSSDGVEELESIDFSVVDAPVILGKLDSTQFHSKIQINDLPQKVRVLLSQQYPIIVEQTNVSITTRGTFIANASSGSKEEKLHLLVESNDRMDVVNAVSMLKNTIIEGLKGSNEDELRKLRTGGGGGRYKV